MKTLSLFLLGTSLSFQALAEEDLFATLDSSLPVAEMDPTHNFPEERTSDDLVSSDPYFLIRDFYRRRRPSNQIKIPEAKDGERLMWKLGNTMRNLNIPTGNYSVIRVAGRSSGFHIRFLGKLQSDGTHATISEAENEILPGDLVVKENFQAIKLPPVSHGRGVTPANHTKALGKVAALLEPNQEEKLLFAGDRQLLGARFQEYRGGNTVSIGSTFVIRRKGEEIAKAMVVDADLDLATMYVYKANREVRADDEVFTQ